LPPDVNPHPISGFVAQRTSRNPPNVNTTYCGLLKQPDKRKLARPKFPLRSKNPRCHRECFVRLRSATGESLFEHRRIFETVERASTAEKGRARSHQNRGPGVRIAQTSRPPEAPRGDPVYGDDFYRADIGVDQPTPLAAGLRWNRARASCSTDAISAKRAAAASGRIRGRDSP